MFTAAYILSCFLTALAAYQGVLVLIYARLFFRRDREPARDGELPKVAILLSLRGADPDLTAGLKSLLQQDYPCYDLKIVVDSEEDPAAEVVNRVIEELGAENVEVHPLRQKLTTCSLYCGSMAQMARELDDSHEVVVLADGDVIAKPTFLRTLVRPLVNDPQVGAAHGNRWFMPSRSDWGSLVRYMWNVGAVVAIHFLKMPCGGTLAIRTSVLKEGRLVEKFERSLTTDALVRNAITENRYKMRFIPALMTPNQENIALSPCLGFLTRQMLWSRLYHPLWVWGGVVLQAMATSFALAGSLAFMIYGLVSSQYEIAIVAALGLVIYQLAMLLFAAILEVSVRHAIRASGGIVHKWLTLTALIKLPFVLPLTQCVQFLAILKTLFAKHVTWRGVSYDIRGKFDIEMKGYQQFEQTHEGKEATSIV